MSVARAPARPPSLSISIQNVTLALGERTVLQDVNLRFPAGQITGVVGPNGAGKSTLLRACAGLMAPVRGVIQLNDRPLTALSREDRARAIAYLPQERAVHWPLSARAVVALGRLPHGDSHAEIVARALSAMHIDHLADRPVGQLSGGERARVLVARALAQEAPLIIADEPTAGLDPAHGLMLFGLFERLASEGHSIIVALHDLSLAARFAHHVVLVADGRIAAAGPPSHVLSAKNLEPAFDVSVLCTAVDGLPIVVPVRTRT